MVERDPEKTRTKVSLQLNRTTIRTLRKADLEEVVGGTIFGGFTLSGCTQWCCPSDMGYQTCYNCPGLPA